MKIKSIKDKEKKYLILDISIKTKLIILATKNKIIDMIKFSISKEFVENIIPFIQKIIHKNNIKLKDLNGIIVGQGPGAFIGIRIAVLTSKILSIGLNIPLYKISSLILLSSGHINKNNIITPKIYAYNNLYYGISFQKNKIILSENIYNNSVLNRFSNHLLLDLNNIKISLLQTFFYMKKVLNPHFLKPKYYDIN
ncbi:tRNA threonylcarbamoyl adenosine modification protein YeaZ [Candidatus Phytoplasma oryzae]|uniref:tRNA threonylcarbamoyl adenosine modification protein YeaZ n=1 Tax=Candidatus Phytoplasma oryzae TaxID=203274 RepID=A0A139JQW3_9MOLU|nr:tRNA (adenosine(37)-N6)-threonylcarbamoyltransferase complex dimerization subunit type 1 TsaB [Candidatus Phytoplasma oryzae]KXT29338.1 tRNA threonylcarbamoyl adenosine modification protein YeaZ [Candidatus Phytoplasma oryzae]RAM57892.1 hypothetical protein DH96_01065 [Candidatus Phytoplasma oryzae]